jgi:hypothetical protein
MLSLVEGKYLTPAAAIQAAQAIHAVNPIFITAKVLAAFRQKVAEKSAKN